MDKKIYEGSCHCGAVRFTVNTDLANTVTCNCSMCHRAGSVLAFVPKSEFTLLSGEDHLTNYKFNKMVIDHLFCNVCGIKPFGRGKDKEGNDTVAVNVRCLKDVNLSELNSFAYNGKET